MKVKFYEFFPSMHKPASYRKEKNPKIWQIFHFSTSTQLQVLIDSLFQVIFLWRILCYLVFLYSYIRLSEVIAVEIFSRFTIWITWGEFHIFPFFLKQCSWKITKYFVEMSQFWLSKVDLGYSKFLFNILTINYIYNKFLVQETSSMLN